MSQDNFTVDSGLTDFKGSFYNDHINYSSYELEVLLDPF